MCTALSGDEVMHVCTWSLVAQHVGKFRLTSQAIMTSAIRDEPLMLLDIMVNNIYTVVGHEQTPDEVNFAAGLHFSGFNRVTGTPRAVDDDLIHNVVTPLMRTCRNINVSTMCLWFGVWSQLVNILFI